MDFVFNFAKNNLDDFTMDTIDIIKTRQLEWAKRNIGKEKLNNDYPFYCNDVKDNIFDNELDECVKTQFDNAKGNELDDKKYPAKMKALYSSSALCVNVFQYFAVGEGKNNALELLVACKLISDGYSGNVLSINFEETSYKISDISEPNIDVVVKIESESKKQLFAIESKFSEPYSSHRGNFLKEKYCSKENREIWMYKDCDIYDALKIDNKENICRLIKKDGKEEREEGRYIFDYKYLDGAQLVKHILGATNSLKNNTDEKNTEITLFYLWYDALGAEGAMHREEIEDFRKTIEDATCQKIKVRHATYQEVIAALCNNLDYETHKNYINYLTERYL